MALHYDFPYTYSELYCNSCKRVTNHNWKMVEYQCGECGSVWDEELIRVLLKQDQYGKLSYECIILSDKPTNSTSIPSTKFDKLEDCLEWLKKKAGSLSKEITNEHNKT